MENLLNYKQTKKNIFSIPQKVVSPKAANN